jgi:hypothetical protein
VTVNGRMGQVGVERRMSTRNGALSQTAKAGYRPASPSVGADAGRNKRPTVSSVFPKGAEADRPMSAQPVGNN